MKEGGVSFAIGVLVTSFFWVLIVTGNSTL